MIRQILSYRADSGFAPDGAPRNDGIIRFVGVTFISGVIPGWPEGPDPESCLATQ
jgi:hypothetical protein